MSHTPLILIDNDEDDQFFFKRTLEQLGNPHPLRTFSTAEAALTYLQTTSEQPFLTFCELVLPGMNGLELRQFIEADPQLRIRAIPFVFITDPVIESQVKEAYNYTIQGLFSKPMNAADWSDQLAHILAYWTVCIHPKRFEK